MSIEFICEHCGGTLRVEEYLGGQTIQCYHCQAPVVIPLEGQAAIIDFQCLACGAKFRVPSSSAGKRTKCPECGAVLEVPLTSTAPPPAPAAPTPWQNVAPGTIGSTASADEEPPTPPAPRLARHSRYGRRAAPGSQLEPGDSGDTLYVPAQQKMGPGMILLFIGIAAVVVIGLFAFINSQSTSDVDRPRLLGRVKYDPVRDAITIFNTMADTWHGVVITIKTRSGVDYVHQLDQLSPRESVTIECNQFKAGDRAYDSTRDKGTDLIVRATCRGEMRRMDAILSREEGGAPGKAFP